MARWLPAVLIGETFLLLASWTWGRCADVQVDFGREAYVAWRLAEGDVLYRDVHSIFGPLSPYWNAAGLRVLGTSLRSLFLLNLGALLAIVALMWLILRRITSRVAATAGILAFLCAFAFAHATRAGSFNFVAPYRHELVHGTVLSLAALLLASRYADARARWRLVACGASLGLLALTKVEPFAAAAAGVAALLLAERRDPRRALPPLGVVGSAAAAVFVLAVLALAIRLPWPDALRGAGATFVTATSAAYNSSPFVRHSMGLAELGPNVRALIFWCAVYLGWLAVGALAARVLRRWRGGWCAAATGLAVAALVWPVWPRIAWADAARPLPVVVLAVALATVATLPRYGEGEDRVRIATRLAVAVYAFVMIAKIALTARAYFYGFALAPAAMLLLVAAALDWLPAALERRGYSGAAFRGVAAALLLLAVHAHLRATSFQLSRQRYAFGAGADRILGDERARALASAGDTLRATMQADDTLAVLPEGLLLNYVLRRPNPSPYVDYMPSEVGHYGERLLVDALSRRPPDWIALVEKDTSEYGPRYFGHDYGMTIGAWVAGAYRPVSLVGSPPFTGAGFGVLLLRHGGGASGSERVGLASGGGSVTP